MEVSQKIKQLRKENGLSQQELAQRIFVSRSAVAKWENGLGLPSEESCEVLAQVFGVQKSYFQTENPEGIIIQKNKRIKTLSRSIWIALIIGAIFFSFFQTRRNTRLNQSLEQLDARIAMEFNGAKSMLSHEFAQQEYTPLLARKLEKFEMVCLYGYYLDGFSGGDAQWCLFSQALGEVNNEEIFRLLSPEDCRMIADFLAQHDYHNCPQITREDISPILERIESILQEYTAS